MELRQRIRPAVYWDGKDRAALPKEGVKSWAAPLGKAAAVAFELQPTHLSGGQLCAAPGCGGVCGQRALRGGSFVGLCDAHLAEQCVGGSFEGATWSVNGRCIGCWSEVDASDSWLLSSGHRACQGCAATVAAELCQVEDALALRCLACDCLLQRPLHIGLDGRARCPGCRKRLVSATTFARRTVLRLDLLWLKACSQLCPRIVGAAHGVYLSLGRRLVLAGLQALSPSPQPAREAIMQVSLAAVGPVFGRVTFDWLHDVWHELGLLWGITGCGCSAR